MFETIFILGILAIVSVIKWYYDARQHKRAYYRLAEAMSAFLKVYPESSKYPGHPNTGGSKSELTGEEVHKKLSHALEAGRSRQSIAKTSIVLNRIPSVQRTARAYSMCAENAEHMLEYYTTKQTNSDTSQKET